MAEDGRENLSIGDAITQGIISPSTGIRLAPSLGAIRLGLSAFGSRGPISPGAARELGEVQGFQQGLNSAQDVLSIFQQGQQIRENQINLETLPERNRLGLRNSKYFK